MKKRVICLSVLLLIGFSVNAFGQECKCMNPGFAGPGSMPGQGPMPGFSGQGQMPGFPGQEMGRQAMGVPPGGPPMPLMSPMPLMQVPKSMIGTPDGGVIVLAGNRLLKYDKDLNLLKEVEIEGSDMPRMGSYMGPGRACEGCQMRPGKENFSGNQIKPKKAK